MAADLVKGEGFAVDASVMAANASRYHGKAACELDWTDAQRQKRAVAEYLAGLEAEAQVQEGGDRGAGGSDGTPNASSDRKLPKVISPSDPSSARTAKANKRVQFGYGLNYLIDVENAIIVKKLPRSGGLRAGQYASPSGGVGGSPRHKRNQSRAPDSQSKVFRPIS